MKIYRFEFLIGYFLIQIWSFRSSMMQKFGEPSSFWNYFKQQLMLLVLTPKKKINQD